MLLPAIRTTLYKYSCFAKRKARSFKSRGFRKLRKILSLNPRAPFPKGFSFPAELKDVPFAEEEGIVLKTTRISIRNVLAPYNASLVEHGQNYLLFFRYDTKVDHPHRPYHTHIGCAQLDPNFAQIGDFVTIDTKSDFSEDPRVIKTDEKLYLTYNDFIPQSYFRRSIHLCCLDPKELTTEYITNFHIDKKPIEKNWAPFIYENELHFDYYITPRQILKIPNPQMPHVEFLEKSWQRFPWASKWGFPRGGTPPRKVGDEYLSFFHSSFLDRKGVAWYVMGAYTFEARPPFRITAVSPHPLLFKGIYDSPILNTAYPFQRAAFPAGVAINHGKMHISLGENDSCVKIVTIEPKAIMKLLRRTHA